MVSLLTPINKQDPEWLLNELLAAQLLDEHTSGKLLTRFRASSGDQSPAKDFALFLVQNHFLSEYQANLALNGYAQKANVGAYQLIDSQVFSGHGNSYKAIRRSDQSPYTLALLPLRDLWSVREAKRHLQVIQDLPPHPTLVPLQDLDTANNYHFFAWPEVSGESFRTLVERAGSLPSAHAARFMIDVADGLAVCHRAYCYHGMLSPNGLLLGPDRRPRILDLGLGSVLFENLSSQESMVDTLTRSRLMISTLDCMAPELLSAQSLPSAESDVYSYGCILFYLLTGSLPFPARNSREQMRANLTQKVPAARDVNPAISNSLSQFVEELLNKDPHQRPNDLAEVRDRLTRVVEERETMAISAPMNAMSKSQFRGDRVDEKGIDNQKKPVHSEVSFNLPETGEQASFEMAVSGAFPLPGLEEVESLEEALERASRLAEEVKEAERAAEDEKKREPRRGLLPAMSKPELDEIPHPVAWVANNRVNLEVDSNGSSLNGTTTPLPPKPLESFWTRALRSLIFWGPTTDLVQVSLFGPATITTGQPVKLAVYVHTPDDFKNVKTLSRAMNDKSELLAVGNPDRMIPRHHEFGLHLSVANGGVAKSVHRFSWEGKPTSFVFELLVPWESPAGRSPAVLSLGLDNVLTGRVPFAITIRARAGA
jgi:serine/threonine protein kinase